MVCVPCIVVPAALWVFYRFIYPLLQKFFPKWFPVTEKSDELKPTEFTAEMLATDEGKFVQKMIQENTVMMFGKTTCTYCRMAKKTLDSTGVSYTVEEIDKREDTDTLQDLFQKLTGARSVPRVFIGQKCIGGGSETMSMNSEGRLVPMMKEAGATFKKVD